MPPDPGSRWGGGDSAGASPRPRPGWDRIEGLDVAWSSAAVSLIDHHFKDRSEAEKATFLRNARVDSPSPNLEVVCMTGTGHSVDCLSMP